MASTALASIQDQIKKELAAQRSNIIAEGGRINTKGKVFTMPDGTVLKDTLTAIILDYRFTNVYYKAAWDGQTANRPDCSSTGANQADLVPDVDITDPVSKQCEGCAMNEWGSASNGRNGKACQNKVRLALVTPDADPNSPIYFLDLTPTALKSFNAYMDSANNNGVLPISLLSEITFDQASTYPTLRLKAIGENKNWEKHWSIKERAQHSL